MASVDDSETRSDAELCHAVRDGDVDAWEALWRRHYDVGLRTARATESRTSPEDLVSEAFVRIAETLRKGGGKGPLAGLFRPYLYVTIRSLAARSWRIREEPEELDELDQAQWMRSVVAPACRDIEAKLNDSLLARSFSTLPTRWQEVLWYTEVERLSGCEAGRLMGLSEAAVASLAYRARKALRAGWIQLHVASDATDVECRAVLSQLGEYSAGAASANVRTLIGDHLGWCTSCRIAHEDAGVVASRLGSVLAPTLLAVPALLAEAGGAVVVPPAPPLPGIEGRATRESARAETVAAASTGVVGGAPASSGGWGMATVLAGVAALVLGLGVLVAVWQPWDSAEEGPSSASVRGPDDTSGATGDLPEGSTPPRGSEAEALPQDADSLELTFSAADAAGNVSPDATKVFDLAVPSEVDASKLTSSAEALAGAAGAAKPGMTATVKDAESNVVGSGVVNPDGSFRVVLDPAQDDGARLTLTLTEVAGDATARRR